MTLDPTGEHKPRKHGKDTERTGPLTARVLIERYRKGWQQHIIIKQFSDKVKVDRRLSRYLSSSLRGLPEPLTWARTIVTGTHARGAGVNHRNLGCSRTVGCTTVFSFSRVISSSSSSLHCICLTTRTCQQFCYSTLLDLEL